MKRGNKYRASSFPEWLALLGVFVIVLGVLIILILVVVAVFLFFGRPL